VLAYGYCQSNVRMCVYIIQISIRTIDRKAYVLGSFERSTLRLIGCEQFCDLIWHWPIYLAPKWPLQRKSTFFRYIMSICERTTRVIEITSMDRPRLSIDTKMSPTTSPPHLWGWICGKNANSRILPFQIIKLWAKLFRSTIASGHVVRFNV